MDDSVSPPVSGKQQKVEPETQKFSASVKKPAITEPASQIAPDLTAKRKRTDRGKIIATILGTLLLVVGIGAGVLLVQQNQEIRERATGANECVQAANCILLDEPGNNSNLTSHYKTDRTISHIFITGRDVYKFEPGASDDDCYRVTLSKNLLMWEKYGSGSSCKEIVNIQIWLLEVSSTK